MDKSTQLITDLLESFSINTARLEQKTVQQKQLIQSLERHIHNAPEQQLRKIKKMMLQWNCIAQLQGSEQEYSKIDRFIKEVADLISVKTMVKGQRFLIPSQCLKQNVKFSILKGTIQVYGGNITKIDTPAKAKTNNTIQNTQKYKPTNNNQKISAFTSFQLSQDSFLTEHLQTLFKCLSQDNIFMYGKFTQLKKLIQQYQKRILRMKVNILKQNCFLAQFLISQLKKIANNVQVICLKKYCRLSATNQSFPLQQQLRPLFLICKGQIQKTQNIKIIKKQPQNKQLLSSSQPTFSLSLQNPTKTTKRSLTTGCVINNDDDVIQTNKLFNLKQKKLQQQPKHPLQQPLIKSIKTIMTKGQFIGDDELRKKQRFKCHAFVKSQNAVLLKFCVAEDILENIDQYNSSGGKSSTKNYYSEKQINLLKRLQCKDSVEKSIQKRRLKSQMDRITLSPLQKSQKKVILTRHTKTPTNGSGNKIYECSQRQIMNSLKRQMRLLGIKTLEDKIPQIEVYQSYGMKNRHNKNQILAPLTIVKNSHNRGILKMNTEPNQTSQLKVAELYQIKQTKTKCDVGTNISVSMKKVQRILGKKKSYHLDTLKKKAKQLKKGQF